MDVDEDLRRSIAATQRSLLHTAWVLTGDWAAAEDLVQTALIRAWPHWRRVSRTGGGGAYVRRIMINKSLDRRRRPWRGEVPTAVLPDRPAATPEPSGPTRCSWGRCRACHDGSAPGLHSLLRR